MGYSSPLGAAEADALKQVDVQLGWINHGFAIENLKGNGPAVLDAGPADFAVAHDLVWGLQPGDIFARESNAALPPTPPLELVRQVDLCIRRSPFVNHSPLQQSPGLYIHWEGTLRGSSNQPDAISKNPDLAVALDASAELIRRFRLASPMVLYADCLAVVRGVRRVIADSPSHRYWEGNRRRQGNADMARGLGDAALSMLGDAPEGATLAFLAGNGHRRGVEKHLRKADVSFTSAVAKTPRGATLRHFGTGLLLGVDAYDKMTEGEWLRDAQQNRPKT